MYILTDEQIKSVEDWLNTWAIDEDIKIGKTTEQLREIFYPALGDAPFEFEDTFITNPLLTEWGLPLDTYERACDHYGLDVVNRFFAKVLEHRFGVEAQEEKEEIIEAAVDNKISDKPRYKDDKLTIYNFKDIDKLDELVKDDIDIGVTNGNFLLITSADNVDDDFVSEGEDMYVVDLESGLLWSNNSVENIDDLKQTISSEAWSVIDDQLKNETLYASCGIKDTPDDATFSLDIKWEDLKDYFREVKSNSRVDTIPGSVAYDIVNSTYQPSVFIDDDGIENVINDISEENLESIADKFNVNKDDIKKALRFTSVIDNEKEIAIYRLINNSLYNILYNSEYSNLIDAVYKGIKECFPGYFNEFLEYDADGIHIKNCPKLALSKVMNEYIEQQEHNDWLENIYSETITELIGGLIALNLFIREDYSYQNYDVDEFNDMIDTLINEK